MAELKLEWGGWFGLSHSALYLGNGARQFLGLFVGR